MSEHADRIRHSSAVSNLRDCVELLRALPHADWEIDETQDLLDLLDRLTLVTENVLGRLTIADRNLVSINAVEALDHPSQLILDTVKSLKDTAPSVEIDLHYANNEIDEFLDAASALPVIPIRTTNKVIERAAEQFDREASSARAAISAKVNSLRQEIQSTVEETNRSFAETQSTIESLNARINEATGQLQREVTSIQEVFRESQSQRNTEFIEDQANRNHEFHEKLDSTIEDIKRFRDEANKMLEEVAGASTAAHYVGQSQQQSKTADRWRKIGVGALSVLALASGWVFFESSQSEQDFSVTWLIARTGLWGSLIVFSVYALQQSSKHRRQAENMGRLANELQLLWPFMNRLPSEHKEALLLDITPLYFRGQSSDEPRKEKQSLARKLLDKLWKARVDAE